MSEKDMLKLILEKVTGLEQRFDEIDAEFNTIHTKLDIIMEQTARNTELESTVNNVKSDVEKLKDDVTLIKRVIAN